MTALFCMRATRCVAHLAACTRLICDFDCLFVDSHAAVIESLNLCNTSINREAAFALEKQLSKFVALKHLDLSNNGSLRVLPVGILRIVARLESFVCDKCSLVLPPQQWFAAADKNPGIVQEILSGKMEEVDFSHIEPYENDFVDCAVSFLRDFSPNVKHLNMSGIRNRIVGSILWKLTGTLLHARACVASLTAWLQGLRLLPYCL